jgi:hypothetical protein
MGAQSRPQQGNGVLMFLNFVARDGVSEVLINAENVVSVERHQDGVRLRVTSGQEHLLKGWDYRAVLDALSSKGALTEVRKSPEIKIVNPMFSGRITA